MENPEYNFKQFETGIVAFIGNFSNKLNNIIGNIPVYVQDTGDETFWFKEKFENVIVGEGENYSKVPRVVLSIDSVEQQTDQDTNQYVKINYLFNDKIYNSQARRKALNLPFTCAFVASNFIKALEYFEVLMSVLSIDNTFTYEFLGNNYQGSYNSESISFEKTPMDNGGTKNFIINLTINVQLQPYILRFDTIVDNTELYNSDGNGGKKIIFNIETNNHDLKNIDILDTSLPLDNIIDSQIGDLEQPIQP